MTQTQCINAGVAFKNVSVKLLVLFLLNDINIEGFTAAMQNNVV
jgi:hypothetical protein